jgi:hypothetical protein
MPWLVSKAAFLVGMLFICFWFKVYLGSVQGSILGPVLPVIFVSPILDVRDMFAFADDSFIPLWYNSLSGLIVNMEKFSRDNHKVAKAIWSQSQQWENRAVFILQKKCRTNQGQNWRYAIKLVNCILFSKIWINDFLCQKEILWISELMK